MVKTKQGDTFIDQSGGLPGISIVIQDSVPEGVLRLINIDAHGQTAEDTAALLDLAISRLKRVKRLGLK